MEHSVQHLERSPVRDVYPSRLQVAGSAQLRHDPVVYTDARSRAPITQEQVGQYEESGYLVLNDLFSAAEVALFKAELELLRGRLEHTDVKRIAEPGAGEVALRSIFAIHQSSKLFARLASDSRLVDLARFLLDDEVYIHQSRLNYKPGFRGKEFFWHSDFETWHAEDGMPRMRALSMLVALTQNDVRNGGLMFIPGSHRFFISCEGETPENNYLSSLRKQECGLPSNEQLSALVAECGIVTADVTPGSAIVFDCNLLHGSNSNITPWPRSNAFFVYNAMSNRVGEPFCARSSRPEHVCARLSIEQVRPICGEITDE